jgi:hypothetical protein
VLLHDVANKFGQRDRQSASSGKRVRSDSGFRSQWSGDDRRSYGSRCGRPTEFIHSRL